MDIHAKKVLIIDTVSYERAPYIKVYEKQLKESNVNYDIFTWNREEKRPFDKKGHVYIFSYPCEFGGSKVKKILPMLYYRQQLLKILDENHYTHLIVIDSLAGVMLHNYIIDHYAGKYIMDIRDYTYEKYNLYSSIIRKLINKSYFTTISSRGFKRFLGESEKFVLNHNISNENQVSDEVTVFNQPSINIAFVGSVRYFDINKLLIEQIAKSSKITLLYAGRTVADCDLKGYCSAHNYSFVRFIDAFRNEQKPLIYEGVDFINALYGTHSLEVTTAMPNRYYDCLIFKKPIIASKGTYLGDLVVNQELGISVDIKKDDVTQEIEDYIKSFDKASFRNRCNCELNKVLEDQRNYIQQINCFLHV